MNSVFMRETLLISQVIFETKEKEQAVCKAELCVSSTLTLGEGD